MIAQLLRRGPRYLAVTAFCFGFNNLLLIGLGWQRLHYVWCVLIAVAVMIPLSYVLHARLTFEQAGQKTTFLRFAAVQSLNIPVALALFYGVIGRLGWSMTYAGPLVTSIMFLWNFAGSWWAMRAFGRSAAAPKADR